MCIVIAPHRTGFRRRRSAYRQILAAHVGERQRTAAPRVAGLHRAQRLWHAERRLRAADDGAALALQEILQFADAAFDLLLSRLRHSRHQRPPSSWRPGLAWLRA